MNSVTKKICPHCKKEFLTRDSSKVFCSLSCEDDHKNADKDKEILKNHKPGRPSNKPVKELKKCLGCSTKLKAQRNHDRQINHRKAFEKMESLKSDIEAKIKASEEALAKSEKEQLQLKARVETLYEIYNNLRETAA